VTANAVSEDGTEVVCRLSVSREGLVFSCRSKWGGYLVWCRVVPAVYLLDMTYEELCSMATTFFRKPPVSKRDSAGGADPVDSAFEKRYPTLWAYISKQAFPDGEVRKRSTLVVFCEDGMVKGCLSDKDTEACLWAASSSFAGLLEALEARLTEDAPEWRAVKKKK